MSSSADSASSLSSISAASDAAAAVSVNAAAANPSPAPPQLNALYVFHSLTGIKVPATSAYDASGKEIWTAQYKYEKESEEVQLSETAGSKSEAQTLVAEKYLDVMKPGWRTPQVKPVTVTERTADQALYEIDDQKDCIVVHPRMDAEGKFFVGSVHYKLHVFEERVRAEKDHSACKKKVALMLLKKLSVAGHPLAIKRLQELMPYYFIRRRQMPMEENIETEFKGAGSELGCLSSSSDFFLKMDLLRHTLRNICGFLNTTGGTLWFGVHDSGLIQGMVLTSKERDVLELLIRDEIKRSLKPLSLDYICIRWHEVEIAQEDESIVKLSMLTESLNQSSASNLPSKSILKKNQIQLPQTNAADRAAAPESVRKRLEFLENAWGNRPQATELCILEISVLPSRVAHFWDFTAFYRNGNETVTIPIEMLKAKIRAEPV